MHNPTDSDISITDVPIVALGLMSGTSADGVDAAMIETDGQTHLKFIKAITVPYEPALRESLLQLACNDVSLNNVVSIERQMTLAHVDACRELFRQTDCLPAVVGFHGHTIRHEPEQKQTWQIGDANLLSEHVRCRVVSDFRRRDIAAGGEGAPLAPLFHRELARSAAKPLVILNLGGVANITWLGKNDAILAGDTGPGCGLLDAWIDARTGEAFDIDGKLAASGTPDNALVNRFLSDSFFRRPLPKSADRFQFQVDGIEQLSTADGAATLTMATVRSIVRALIDLPETPRSLLVTGGGARNPTIMQMLQEAVRHHASCDVSSIESIGMRADSLEAECFAWLAVRRLRGLVTSLPETTGCAHATCGGQLTA